MPTSRLTPADLLERARGMRHEPAPAEAAMWRRLRDRQLGGFKFNSSTSKSPSPQPSPGVPGEGVRRSTSPAVHLSSSAAADEGARRSTAIRIHSRGRLCHNGFTLLEMLTTVAALVIVLGLMVDLARYVRNDSSVKLTKQLLYQCDLLLAQYQLHHAGQMPSVELFAVAPDHLDESMLQHRAVANNRDFVAALRTEAGAVPNLFGGLPDSIYNEATLSDAWGSPIVFMPSMHREIGVAPQDHSFFFSAGPDRRYLTQDDNLYSYEEKGPGEGTERQGTEARRH